MPAGRPRKPRALKLVQGTNRPDRDNVRAPRNVRAADLSKPPADLTPLERRAWKHLAGLVEPMRVTTEAHLAAFRQMAISLAMIDQARTELAEYGGRTDYEVISEFGTSYRKRPQIEIIATFKKLLAGELARFGLTPADQEKVTSLDGSAPGDPLDEFAAGGTGAA
jgi:hypothetical protein